MNVINVYAMITRSGKCANQIPIDCKSHGYANPRDCARCICPPG